MFFILGMSTFTWILLAYVGVHIGEEHMGLLKELLKEERLNSIQDYIVWTHHFKNQAFELHVREVFLLVGALALFIEIAKAATATNFGATETLLSFIVSMIFIVMFFTVPWAQNATFLILGIMSLIDATGGFIIELNAARRDINIVGGGGSILG